MHKKNNITGKKFHNLLVLKEIGRSKSQEVLWLCSCDCGNKVKVVSTRLVSGHTKSCGCFRKKISTEKIVKHNTTHGEGGAGKRSPEYIAWLRMKGRCYYKKDISFGRYGKRNITVCDRWLNSFENFLKDMGRKPSLSHSLDRIDNNKNYSPDNCKWATKLEQANNTRNNVFITFNNKTLTIAEWSRELNINISTLRSRIRSKWDFATIVATPVNKYNKKEVIV